MSKKIAGMIIGSVLLIMAIGAYIVIGSLNKETSKDNTNKTLVESASEGTEDTSDTSDRETSVESNKNPFGEKVKTPLKEAIIQQYIHAMSHQKVEAEEKWSFFKITEERIDYLLGQLEVNAYQHEDLYKQILKSWKNGDFSNAASQHNEVWRFQDGTVGKATGLMSTKEEEAFLQSHDKESR